VSGADTIRLADAEVNCRNYLGLGYERLTRGVYDRTLDLDGLDEFQARQARFLRQVHAIAACQPGANFVLYGPTALQVLGVALPNSVADWSTCHILVPRDAFRTHRPGVTVHNTVAPFRVRAHPDGLPVLHPVDHWVQLRGGTVDELVEVGDGLVRRQHPLFDMKSVTRRVSELAGVHGVDRVRQVLRWVVPGTDSIYETRVRMILVRAGLPVPSVNVEVPVPSSNRVYHLDMGYPDAKVGVEYDGLVHVGDRRQMEVDAIRHRDLLDAGWFVVKVTAGQLSDPAQFIHPIERALVMRSHLG